LTIANGASLSDVLDFTFFSGGMLLVPSAWTAADIAFHVSDEAEGTFTLLKDKSGSTVKITSVTTDASYWYEIPTEVFAAAHVKIASINTSTEAAVNQGAARSLMVLVKG
jgi:hypothetical protein